MNTSTKKFFCINEEGLLMIDQGEMPHHQVVTLNIYEFDWLIAHSDEIRKQMYEPLAYGDE